MAASTRITECVPQLCLFVHDGLPLRPVRGTIERLKRRRRPRRRGLFVGRETPQKAELDGLRRRGAAGRRERRLGRSRRGDRPPERPSSSGIRAKSASSTSSIVGV